jgi:hypothetical protein
MRQQRQGLFSALCASAAERLRAFSAIIFTSVALCAMATPASAHLQCAPYAREVSGVALRGNAATWWGQADGVYRRGHRPTPGAVLAFKSTGAMRYGHVAVVSKVLDSRHVLLNHANWTGHGDIQRAALAVDVSDAGDWSAVRVWHSGTGSLGLRANPTYGFIYGEHGADDRDDAGRGNGGEIVIASADKDDLQAGG